MEVLSRLVSSSGPHKLIATLSSARKIPASKSLHRGNAEGNRVTRHSAGCTRARGKRRRGWPQCPGVIFHRTIVHYGCGASAVGTRIALAKTATSVTQPIRGHRTFLLRRGFPFVPLVRPESGPAWRLGFERPARIVAARNSRERMCRGNRARDPATTVILGRRWTRKMAMGTESPWCFWYLPAKTVEAWASLRNARRGRLSVCSRGDIRSSFLHWKRRATRPSEDRPAEKGFM